MLCVFNKTADTKVYTLPYTTLFRSGFGLKRRSMRSAPRLTVPEPVVMRLSVSSASAEALPTPPEKSKREMAQTDRKSTRLNSSHVKISYAVFCLKKKRQNARQIKNI